MLPLEVSARGRNIGTSELILRTRPPNTHGRELPGQPLCRCRTPNPITRQIHQQHRARQHRQPNDVKRFPRRKPSDRLTDEPRQGRIDAPLNA